MGAAFAVIGVEFERAIIVAARLRAPSEHVQRKAATREVCRIVLVEADGGIEILQRKLGCLRISSTVPRLKKPSAKPHACPAAILFRRASAYDFFG